MATIRKDNFVKATTDSGDVYGKVLSSKGDTLVLTTPSGNAAVSKASAVKISAADYKANAVAPTAETFAKAEATTNEPGPAVRPVIVEAVVKPAATKAATTSASRPGKKGTGKKAVAVSVFAELTVDGTIPTRKAFSTAMNERTGLSPAGASTYFYNLKSGRWS